MFENRSISPDQKQDEAWPPIADDFEIIETENAQQEVGVDHSKNHEDSDIFDFPLFSFGPTNDNSTFGKPDSPSHRKETERNALYRISLREPDIEVVVQSRPRDYYFASYTCTDRDNFAKSAITYEDIVKCSKVPWTMHRPKVLDLKRHNDDIKVALQRELKINKRRPSKRQRDAHKTGKAKTEQRLATELKIKKMIKKKFHKRGGKKNKKKPASTILTPRFRTE